MVGFLVTYNFYSRLFYCCAYLPMSYGYVLLKQFPPINRLADSNNNFVFVKAFNFLVIISGAVFFMSGSSHSLVAGALDSNIRRGRTA